MDHLIALLIGFFIDLLLGDPHSIPHPVVWIGKLISAAEKLVRRLFPKTVRGENIAGGVLWVIVVLVSTAVPALLLYAAYRLHPAAGLVLESIMCWQILATRSLRDESMKVYAALKKGVPEEYRRAVSMIVGRDTAELDDLVVTRAAVETVAENASDGVLAPLFYMVIGGAILGVAYKAVNTMDSMVGYKNDRYQYFGTAAARFDDLVNFLPARISAIMMILASFVCGMDGKHAARIYKRDRRKHASPNSAHTEAVMAGALDIQLAGDAWYFGKLHKKDFIGDPIRPVEVEDIVRANRLLYATAVCSVVIFCLVRVLITTLFGGM